MAEETSASSAPLQGVSFEGNDFASLLNKEFKPKSDEAKSAVESAVLTLAQQALSSTKLIGSDVIISIEAMIAEIDKKLSAQVNAILHHADFQQLESAWRGLHYLVNNTETDEMLKIRVFNISKNELAKTVKRYKGTAWDQSPIFKQGLHRGVRPVRRPPVRLPGRRLLLRPQRRPMSSCWAKCPRSRRRRTRRSSPPPRPSADADGLVAGAGQPARPDQDLHDARIRRLALAARIAMTRAMSAWRCRASCRACPMAPRPTRWRRSTSRKKPAAATTASTPGPTRPTRWRVNINRSYKLYGWGTSIRGVEAGGAVEGLPAHTFPTDDGGVDMKCPTEIAISDRREAELAKNGFMPLIHRKNSDFAAFIGAQSLQKPAEYDDPDATANANLAARLPYLFACCRFAHYLKCIVRDKIGSFKERDDDGEVPQQLDHELRRRRPGQLFRRRSRRKSRWPPPKSRSKKCPATPATTAPSSSCDRTTSSKA